MSHKSYYEVLGVEKTADERAIKKAYFALVRRFPPETHPEEFKKVREAYEVLSDAEARKEYDTAGDLGGHGADAGPLSVAREAMDESRFEDAKSILIALLQGNPDLHIARDMLGMCYLALKAPEQALAVFAAQVQAHPNNAAYQLHHGYALHTLKQYPEALAAYQKARVLTPDDVRVLVSMSDAYVDQKQWDSALKVLDEAINLDGTVDFKDFGLFVRKLEVEIERNVKGGVAQILEQLLKVVPADDLEAKSYVADKLAALAAPLFVLKRSDDANMLMREAAKLNPKRATGEFPKNKRIPIVDLPEAARQWLIEQNNSNVPGKIKGSKYLGWGFGLIVGLGGLGLALLIAISFDQPMDAGMLVMLVVGTGSMALLTAAAVLGIRRAMHSPYGAYTVVHPLYLLQVDINHVTAWPLANLQNVKVTHRSTNGVYNGTSVELLFGGANFSTNIYGQQVAVDWAQSVLDKRGRMLELMHRGLLETQVASDPVASLIPIALLSRKEAERVVPDQEKKDRKRNRLIYLVAASLGFPVAAVAYPLNKRAIEERLWRETRWARGTPEPYKAYLRQYPEGRHAFEAKKSLSETYDLALEAARNLPPSELKPALVDIVTWLREHQTSTVLVEFHPSTTFDDLTLPPELAESVINPKDAFTSTANGYRHGGVTRHLGDAFREILKTGLVSFEEGAATSAEAGAPRFIVSYEVSLTKAIYESVATKDRYGNTKPGSDKKFLGIAFDWNFDVQLDGKKKYAFQVASQPAKNIRWTSYGSYQSPTLPYDKMAESAFDDFTRQLSKRFGQVIEADEGAAESDEGDSEPESGSTPPVVPKKKPGVSQQRRH
jgi:tetratricopeptide (TPR) repeat protein